MSSRSSDWTWSENLNQYFKYTGPNGIITEDGVRRPASALTTPRTVKGSNMARPIPGSASNAAPVRTDLRRDQPDASNTSTSPQYKYSSMTDAMGRLVVSRPKAEPDSATVHRGLDRQSRVQSAIQFEPKRDITQPDLYDTGVRAHAKLLAIEGQNNEELFDPAYRVRKQPNKFFTLGKIFLVLWAEPAGANSLVTSLPTNGGIVTGKYKEKIYTKVRRFVVIRVGDRSCSALSILTYDHQGAKKKYMDAAENGIIFTGKAVPAGAPRVPGLLDRPIRVNADDPTDKLDVESLIHYGKVYTIEHNIKVKPFGMVHDDYMRPLVEQFQNVWVHRVGLPRANPTPASIPRSANSQSGSGANPGAVRRGSDAAQSRQPRELTDRQRAALEQYGSVAERLRRQPSDAGGRSDRRSGPGSRGGSEAAETSTAATRRSANQAFIRLRNALIEQGVSEEEADRRARQGVTSRLQAASQRSPTSQEGEVEDAIESEDESDSDDDDRSASRRSAVPSQHAERSPQEIAIEALIARGYTRDDARQLLAQAVARRNDGGGNEKRRQT